ncbi:MAG: 16S rRNA (cytidine(1402)-2'-O)-methyltransferase [Proteobacteria bacterium]|nr:16S rRNA (cytidine(1402)-2'-O)-methyltransferase [Pseudomonadota bacterium]
MSGTLYLVGVPIGNYGDMTFRAVDILNSVDVIAAEDTRRARHLFTHFSISPKRLVAYHAHNEHAAAEGLLNWLAEGKSIAVITDAGMPAVSDPGYLLAKTVVEKGYDLHVIPGVSASVTALAASGLPSQTFSFIGFLPKTSAARQKELAKLAERTETLIFYESPRRIVDVLADMAAVLGQGRGACLCRELTKTHEEFSRGTLQQLSDDYANRAEVLGEITLIVAGSNGKPAAITLDDVQAVIADMAAKGLSAKDIRDHIATVYGIPKREAYAMVLEQAKA